MSSNPFENAHQGEYQPTSPPSPLVGIISLVAGVVTFIPGCCCGLIGVPMAMLAVASGVVGLVMANQGKASGKGMAIAGIACGCIYLLFFAVAMILQMAGVIDPEAMRRQIEQMQ